MGESRRVFYAYGEPCTHITIPLAFELASIGSYNRKKALSMLRQSIVQHKLMHRIVRDIHHVIGDTISTPSIESKLYLWDNKNFINAGKNYSNVLKNVENVK